jgi:phosphatidylglycerol:prolipoprotein diacylglycerol transferase
MNVQGTFHHPTFLYESLWNLVGLILLMILRRQKFLRAGELFASYFIWYSVGRFFIEALRTDSLAFQGASWLASFVNGLWTPMTWLGFEQGYLAPSYGNVRISQLLALGIVVAAIIFIIVRRSTVRDLPYYSDPITSTKVAAADALPVMGGAAESEQAKLSKTEETTVEELAEAPEDKKE